MNPRLQKNEHFHHLSYKKEEKGIISLKKKEINNFL
jgi:hypothetical protein